MSRKWYKRDSKYNVKFYLDSIHSLVESENFDMERDFVLHKGTGRTYYDYGHSNDYMLDELGYTKQKVLNVILSLTVSDYVGTTEPNTVEIGDVKPFFIFTKTIDGNEIYIKLQQPYRKGTYDYYLNCVSFHIASYHMKRPYEDFDPSNSELKS